MVIVRLWGGLGNQLFQYAFGYSMAKKLGTELRLDCRFYTEEFLRKNRRFTKQKLRLLDFPLQYNGTDIPKACCGTISFLQNKYINRLIRIPAFFPIRMPGGFIYLKEGRAQYKKRYTVPCNDVYLDGYWQCEQYFSEFEKEIREQFTPPCNESKTNLWVQKMDVEESVAIHIRRGDYIDNKSGKLYLVPVEYYRDCIEQARRELESPKFYFFSNDIDWVKKTFGHQKEFVFVSGEDGLSTMDEFFLMSRCKHQIVGNSTFSWWAAWLNKNPQKTVWAPARWFGNEDIWPKSWKQVSWESNSDKEVE